MKKSIYVTKSKEEFKRDNPDYYAYLEKQNKEQEKRIVELEKQGKERQEERDREIKEILSHVGSLTERKKEKIELRQKKMNKIQELREKGLSLEEIGREMGVTRERIRQISKFIPEWKNKIHKEPIIIEKPCKLPGCQRMIRGKVSYVELRKFCCREHAMEFLYPDHVSGRTLAEKRAYQNARMKLYVKNVLSKRPDWKMIIHERNQRQIKKLISTPGGHEKIKERARSYYNKRMEDPVRRARHLERIKSWNEANKERLRERSKAFYQRKRQDPEWLEKKKAQSRARYHARKNRPKKEVDPALKEKIQLLFQQKLNSQRENNEV